MTALKIKINGSKIVQRLVQKERKASRKFDGAEIKDFEGTNMATCHMHRKSVDTVEIIGARWRRRLVWKEEGV